MSRLDKRKSKLLIETSDCVREHGRLREVIVEPSSNGYTLSVRLKGLRTRFEISWAGVYNHAVRIEVEKKRAERKAQKKAGIR